MDIYKKNISTMDIEDDNTNIKTLLSVKVMDAPSAVTNSSRIGKLNKNQIVKTIGITVIEGQTWYLIDYGDGIGYITADSKYIEKVDEDTTNDDIICQATQDNFSEIALRDIPEDDFEKIATIKKDTKLDIIKMPSNGFTKVRYKNIQGYVPTSCLSGIDISKNEPPIIDVKNKYYLLVGSTFKNEDLGAKIADKEDRNIKVSYSGEVDTSKQGVYNITVEATDLLGATTTKNVKVIVRKKSKPIILCDYSTESTALEIEAGKSFYTALLRATAIDRDYGNLSVSSSGTINTTKDQIGQAPQKVILTAKNSQGVVSTKKAYVKVIEDEAPEFTYINRDGKNKLLTDASNAYINIAQGKTVTAQIIKNILNLKAYDRMIDPENVENDKNVTDITSRIQIDGLKNINTSSKGSYNLKLKVTDNSKTTEVNIVVNVVDDDKADIYTDSNLGSSISISSANPTIYFGNPNIKYNSKTGIATLSIVKDSIFDIDSLKATAKDAMRDDCSLTYSDYNINTDSIGEQKIKVIATDKVGRQTVVDLTINVMDGGEDNYLAIYLSDVTKNKGEHTSVAGTYYKVSTDDIGVDLTDENKKISKLVEEKEKLQDYINSQICVTVRNSEDDTIVPYDKVEISGYDAMKYNEDQVAILKIDTDKGMLTKLITLNINQKKVNNCNFRI